MGLLSKNAGVLGGIGQAMQNIGLQKREERLQALAHEREMAIRKMEQDFQAGQKQKDRELTASEGSKNRQVEIGGMMRQDDRAEQERKLRESEGEKDRQSREKIAKIEANSRMGAAGARGAKNKRFTINKVATESMTKEGGLQKAEDIVLTDNASGRTYKQYNDIFLPQGGQQPQRRAPRNAISYLTQNPDLADDFLAKYGYLPAEAFRNTEANSPSTDEEE